MSEFNPYQAPTAAVEDQPLAMISPADRGTRLGAKFLDGIISGGIVLISFLICLPFMPSNEDPGRTITRLIIIGLIIGGAAIGVIAWNLIWISRYGQTVGKRICKIKIVRTNGDPVGVGRVIGLRWLPVTLLGALPFVGYLVGLTDSLLIFRESNQCLHDQIADTIVVNA